MVDSRLAPHISREWVDRFTGSPRTGAPPDRHARLARVPNIEAGSAIENVN
jgi:hypothetical protein